ncbi:hypothetical protein BJ878DRAFT_496921 [Calycina marina]|uniref:Uncharacterized protein n=1 Tax=Calycina marina TaxID=1763456 RepID=A0A9P8CH21_9HELO|nr:hypothetical protein BJ878DRAFT_496921 [Calycina marina]
MMLRVKFSSPQGWLRYSVSHGEVVYRYRWEASCIKEHASVMERIMKVGSYIVIVGSGRAVSC